MQRSRTLDALFAEHVLGCKLVWRDVPRKPHDKDRCSDHASGKQPECHCGDPWEGPGIPIGQHAHFGPSRHDPDEGQRCRAIPYYSENVETLIEIIQDKWTDIAMESSGLNWTAATPIASVTDTDLNVALCRVALQSVGYKDAEEAKNCPTCKGFGKAVGGDGGFYACPECHGVGHVH